MTFHFEVMGDVFWTLLGGARLTFLITVGGLVGGFVLGVMAGSARVYGNKSLDRLAFMYIELIRGTPLLVQMMYIYYALPLLIGLNIEALPASIIAISVNAGAYIGEVVRGSLLSVEKGLDEAGKALGLSGWQVFTSVVGPIAFRRLIPPLGNQFIISLKDTSLCAVIAVAELTREGIVTVATTFRALEIWTEVAILYLIMTQTMAYILRRVEEKDYHPMSMVEFRNVTKSFGTLEVLKNIDLTINPGEVVVIVGPSGSGKSTLLRCINVLEEISSGDLVVDGMNVRDRKTDIRVVRQEAGMVFQLFHLFPHMTALENVALGPRKVRKMNREDSLKAAWDLLAKVGLSDRADHLPSELSGGQQQRVAIARALAVNPKLMLFDEPTSALDPELRGEVLEVMKDLAKSGMTMVVVTHEMTFARDVGDRLLFMDDGQILEDGPPLELLSNPPSERLRSFLRHVE